MCTLGEPVIQLPNRASKIHKSLPTTLYDNAYFRYAALYCGPGSELYQQALSAVRQQKFICFFRNGRVGSSEGRFIVSKSKASHDIVF